MREKVAELMHRMWSEWTINMLNHMTSENVHTWRELAHRKFSHLNEQDREYDLKWADKFLALLEKGERE